MRIMICCSKQFYHTIEDYKEYLESKGHTVILPNCYDNPMLEEDIKKSTPDEHAAWKSHMLQSQKNKVLSADAILILNMPHDNIMGHIGGATFLEAYEAFMNNKTIYLLSPAVPAILADEIAGFGVTQLDWDVEKIS